MTTQDKPLPFLINFVSIYNILSWEIFDKDLEIFLESLSPILEKHIVFTHTQKAELSIVFSNDDEVHKLNEAYRHKDQPTNVLSFTNLSVDDLGHIKSEEDLNLGDIILAYETIQKEAQQEQKEFLDHTKHLIIHGILHVIGYDHMNDKESQEMEGLEIQILKEFNINNPYE